MKLFCLNTQKNDEQLCGDSCVLYTVKFITLSVFLLFFCYISFAYTKCFGSSLTDIESLLEIKLEESGIRGPLIVKFKDIRALPKNADFELVSFDMNSGKTAEVILDVGGMHYKVFATFENARHLVVPLSTIHHGAIITESDLALAKFPVSRYRGEYASSKDLLLGRKTKKVLAANKPIRMSDVKSITVVKSGENVNILYHKGALTIEATGVALEDGGKNEVIRVRNDDTNKTLSGRVLKSKVVLVE